jgi:hypothetical protein
MGDSPSGAGHIHDASILKKHLEYLWLPGVSVENNRQRSAVPNFFRPEANPASGVMKAPKEPALSDDLCFSVR